MRSAVRRKHKQLAKVGLTRKPLLTPQRDDR